MDFDGESLIHRVVTALREGGAERVVVVAPADSPEAAAIAAEAAAAGAEVLVPESQPAEMRDSVELGLAVLDAEPRPDRVLLTPGDRPRHRGGPGRPTAATSPATTRIASSSRLTTAVADIRSSCPGTSRSGSATCPTTPASTGWLTDTATVLEVSVSAPGAIDDLDTPEDLETWLGREAGGLPGFSASGGIDGTRSDGDE